MESRRVDNQARGRSGRQGDEGSSIFYVSLEDDLIRILGSESMKKMLEKLGLKDGESIDCLLYTSPSPRDGLLSRMPSSA